MLKSTEEFVCFLNQNNLKYCLDSINANGNEQITMCITSQTLSDIKIYFLFDSNNQIVYIRIWNLLKIPDQFNSIALTIINELNNTYRFVRFCWFFNSFWNNRKNLYKSWNYNRKNMWFHLSKVNRRFSNSATIIFISNWIESRRFNLQKNVCFLFSFRCKYC